MFYLPIALTILSNVFYHLAQKFTPQNISPVLSLAVSYTVAALICLALLPAFPLEEGLREELRKLNWTALVLAVTIVGLEIGFLLAYRAGWLVSAAGVVSNTIVALLLLPVGVWLLKDRLSTVNLAGVVVSIVGLVLVNWKS